MVVPLLVLTFAELEEVVVKMVMIVVVIVCGEDGLAWSYT